MVSENVVPGTVRDASFSNQVVPIMMASGTEVEVRIRMLNTGLGDWTAKEEYRLGSQAPHDNQTWGSHRVDLLPGEVVRPGSEKEFVFRVTAPSKPGLYDFQWRMVQERVAWFGQWTQKLSISVY